MKEKKRIFTGYTIYLLVLLAVVLAYTALAFPRLQTKMGTLDAQYLTLRTEIDLLAPYETRHAELDEQMQDARAEYEESTVLMLPAQFTNGINTAADAAGVVLESVTVQDRGETALAGGYTGNAATATVTVELAPGQTPATFLSALESQTGAGFYVDAFSFAPQARTPEQGGAPAGEAAGEPSRLTVDVTCYNIAK